MKQPSEQTLERACKALASLVRVEFGDRYTLAEIADTWGEGILPEHVDALRELESTFLAELGNELVHNAVESRHVESPNGGD